jgi:hypothetical protein
MRARRGKEYKEDNKYTAYTRHIELAMTSDCAMGNQRQGPFRE